MSSDVAVIAVLIPGKSIAIVSINKQQATSNTAAKIKTFHCLMLDELIIAKKLWLIGVMCRLTLTKHIF